MYSSEPKERLILWNTEPTSNPPTDHYFVWIKDGKLYSLDSNGVKSEYPIVGDNVSFTDVNGTTFNLPSNYSSFEVEWTTEDRTPTALLLMEWHGNAPASRLMGRFMLSRHDGSSTRNTYIFDVNAGVGDEGGRDANLSSQIHSDHINTPYLASVVYNSTTYLALIFEGSNNAYYPDGYSNFAGVHDNTTIETVEMSNVSNVSEISYSGEMNFHSPVFFGNNLYTDGNIYKIDSGGDQHQYVTTVELAEKVNITDVVDNLTSTDTDKPLSANQGKLLQDNKEDADSTILKEGDVEDTLTSTSTTKPLSANQGRLLEDNKASLSGADFSAMPTVDGNPVVESGSNSDGEWIRWADGTQIVYRVEVEEVGWNSSNIGDWYEFGNLSFPQSFVDTPLFFGGGGFERTGISTNHTGIGFVGISSRAGSHKEVRWNRVYIRLEKTTDGSNDLMQFAKITLGAIGRWY